MANKDLLTDELKAAQDNLKNLQARRDDLSRKISDFELQLSKLDLSDTSAAIKAVQSVTQSLETHHAILERINNEIPAANNRVATAQRKVNDAASESLRKDEQALYKDAVQKLDALALAISKLEAVHKSLWKNKQPARCKFGPNLVKGVAEEIAKIKHTAPELIGLPHRQSKPEIDKILAGMDLDRMEERLKKVEAYPWQDRPGDYEKVHKAAKADLEKAKAVYDKL